MAAGTWDGSLGGNYPEGWAYLFRGGKLVGTTGEATGYRAERQSTAAAPGFMYFRHRVYDQATGRWTQEDPLGIAGGLNLYQFNGSNPSAFTDPFGLTPGDCKKTGRVAITICLALSLLKPIADQLPMTPPAPVPVEGSESRPIGDALRKAGSRFATGIQNTGNASPRNPFKGLPPGGTGNGVPTGGQAVGSGAARILGVLGAVGGAIFFEALRPIFSLEPQSATQCQIEKCPAGTPLIAPETPATIERRD